MSNDSEHGLKTKNIETKMSKPISQELSILQYGCKYTNEKKFHDFSWVIVHEDKILCQGIKKYPFIIYHPIIWKDHKAAEVWIESGSIAEIQESFTNLNIGFHKTFLEFI